MTIDVTVVSVEATELVVVTADGEELIVDGRTWSFAFQSDFQAAVGDALQLTGFYENGEFEIGALRNLTTAWKPRSAARPAGPLWAWRRPLVASGPQVGRRPFPDPRLSSRRGAFPVSQPGRSG